MAYAQTQWIEDLPIGGAEGGIRSGRPSARPPMRRIFVDSSRCVKHFRCLGLLQMDADPVTLAAYQSSVQEKAAGLGPALIYLDPGDAESAVRAIAQQRGPAWTDYAIAVVTECPYASSECPTHLPAAFRAWTEPSRSYGPISMCSTSPSRDFHSRSSFCQPAIAAGWTVTRGSASFWASNQPRRTLLPRQRG